MSGGERKKRGSDKGHGWEEAGAEFYQERYPAATEADLQQVLQRDPSHIATLLPSKKSRVATAKRIRNEPRTTLRRRTSTRSRGTARTSTVRRMSTNVPDAQNMSMLPDLSENLSNEERTWEEIMQIKTMPVCMAQKIQLKRQLQNATKLRLQGFEQLKWQRRKAWQQFQIRLKEAYSKMELWSTSLKKIGGNFGMGIVAYFLFIKWLMYLNIILFIIMFCFISLPSIVLTPSPENCTGNTSSIACCSETYLNVSHETSNIIDIMQGGSPLERTILFYGVYTNEIYGRFNDEIHYNLPLAYICTTISFFLISLIAIVRSAAKGFRERVTEGEGQFYQYCNLIFGGWDFCIQNEKSADIKHKALYNEIKAFLEAERLEEERQNRTREENIKLFLVRLIVNLLVLAVLAACGLFIYYIIDVSFDRVSNPVIDSSEETGYISLRKITQLLYEFLPYICIVGLNVIVPFLFRYLVALEHYSPLFVVRLTLFRIVFLRLASLALLLTSLYKIIAVKVDEEKCTNVEGRRPVCWETFVGQQFLKLYVTDLFTQFFVTFFVNFPRSLIARHTENKLLRFIGEQEFDLPHHVLDIVYSQTICWVGTFFAPLLPLVAAAGCFLLFYFKKFACLVNSTPSSHVYRASRSNSLFMFVLLVSFILVTIPVGYSIAEIEPSKSCGPFRGLGTVWSFFIGTFEQFPGWIQSVLFFLGTAGFGIPAFITLSLLLYYYYAVSIANKHMVIVLKNQLVLEGHDKQFLLNRLSAFIKQQQEQSKYQQDQSIDLGNFN
ncbi:transmembrane channel-like protein 7 isoform X1 [Diachasma alloeum]|uniref:transmembrane channel-like protein 7 isoform X1 n=2 Tax=Diachasma alloeum TaxID=454923 RepID=UPI0007384171|nr:transmembrane channel-like protein 7 isoform X1 [Diachasma alloeum]XP_028982301.1 transmembrane channel-like protein 7 isoform X1 [Diachasma alloeum]